MLRESMRNAPGAREIRVGHAPSTLCGSVPNRVKRPSGDKRDGGEFAPVIGFAPVGGAPEAVEVALACIGIGAESREVCDTRSPKPCGDVRFQIETIECVAPAGREERTITGIRCQEPIAERRVHLIAAWPMQGPMAAAMRARAAPSFSIAAMVESVTPPSAPFQPACAAPITPALVSAKRTGAQSAVSTPSAMPGTLVTLASACGLASTSHGVVTVTARALWIWYKVQRCPAPRAASARLRFASTWARSSADPGPQLSEA